MARRFTKVSKEEIVAITEATFFYPSDLVNAPQGRGRAIDIYLDASRLGTYSPLCTSPSGDSCILLLTTL